MSRLIASAADIFLGTVCPSCEKPGLRTCRSCVAALQLTPIVSEVIGVPVVSAGAYDDELREVLLSWKVGQRHGHDAVLAHFLAVAVLELIAEANEVVLVPIPASARSRRERKRDHIAELAKRARAELARVGVAAKWRRGLRLVRQPAEQHNLGKGERQRNLAGSMQARRFGPKAAPVVVVDDILTTGATLAEAVATLQSQPGIRVLGAATVAATR